MFRQNFARISLSALIVLLTACQGGGGTTALAPTSPTSSIVPQGTGKVQVSIAVPSLQSEARNPQYISASTRSAQVQIGNNGSTSGTPTTLNCATSCSANITAPLGTDTFIISLFSQANGQGSLLSQGTTTASIIAGQSNTVSIVFNGAIARVALTSPTMTVTPGQATKIPITVTAFDAAGNTIVGSQPYLTPITLVDSDTSGATSLAPTSITAPSSTATLTYTGAKFSGATISPSVSGNQITSTALTITAASATAQPSATPTHSSATSTPAPLGAAPTTPNGSVPSHMKIYAVLPGDFHNSSTMSGSQVSANYATIAKYVDYLETDNRAANFAHNAGIKVGFYTDPIDAHGSELNWPDAAFAHDCSGNVVIPNYPNTSEKLGDVNSATLTQSWNAEIQAHLRDQWGTYSQDFVRSDDSGYPGEVSQGYFAGYFGGPREPAGAPYCHYSDGSFLGGLRGLFAQAAVPVIFNGATDPSYSSYVYGASNTLGGQCETCFGGWTGAIWQNHVNAEISFVGQGKIFNSYSHGNAQPAQQLYLYASMLLGYDPQYTVLAMDISTPSGISATPLAFLVPMQPTVTASTVAGYLQPEGVYVRQFGACYIKQVSAGPCAVVVNASTSTHSVPTNLSNYHHTVNFSGSGIASEFGDTGSINAQGSQPPSQLGSMNATILFQ